MTPQQQADQIERTAKALEDADREWRKKAGYTGSPVHRPAYFWALANHLRKRGELKTTVDTAKEGNHSR